MPDLNLSGIDVTGPGGTTRGVSIVVDPVSRVATLTSGTIKLLVKDGVESVSTPTVANRVQTWMVEFDDGDVWEVNRKMGGCRSCGGRG